MVRAFMVLIMMMVIACHNFILSLSNSREGDQGHDDFDGDDLLSVSQSLLYQVYLMAVMCVGGVMVMCIVWLSGVSIPFSP